ncbi:jasmonate-induced oxygenase 4-like [Ziziphus jujuba]|uniref:Jasmonate-induced oxygenase 4-like n=1 Tax=Ziziphus jujuba TaxID=326968 RepID=A0ABM3ZZD9_ZIZJJ|nr:jasmonate-induced oxygenase 4-like [Ziziphus jujuba]
MKTQRISEVVFKAMARSLSLEENCFLSQCGEQATPQPRFNFYPKCGGPGLVLGLKPHADGSAIAIVLQDKNVEGLQLLKDNQWFKAPIIPEALLINVGDQVEISSNGMFKSPVHRVVTNSKRNRISVSVFYGPETDKEIKPFDRLVDNSRPRLYKKVKNYCDICFQYYQQGKRPIDAAKLPL